ARENLERNGVAEAVTLENALVDHAYLDALGPGSVDLIVANVLSGVLIPLLPAFRRVLAPAGRAILGGLLTTEADPVVAAAEAVGAHVAGEEVEDDGRSGHLAAR